MEQEVIIQDLLKEVLTQDLVVLHLLIEVTILNQPLKEVLTQDLVVLHLLIEIVIQDLLKEVHLCHHIISQVLHQQEVIVIHQVVQDQHLHQVIHNQVEVLHQVIHNQVEVQVLHQVVQEVLHQVVLQEVDK